MFYMVIMFKHRKSGKRRKEQLVHDISHKGNAMDRPWRLTTLGDEPKHHRRKAHKKTKMVVGMI